MKLAHELKRLGKHSAIYGLGGLVSRILATFLLPLYTHYLPPGAYGRVEVITAATAGEPGDELSSVDRDWAERHGVPPDELVELACRSMKCVDATSDELHERLSDLRYRLGDVAAA